MAVITSIAVATAATAASAAMKAKADQKSAKAANDANYNQYLDSRGANGNAVLPMYADPGTEKRLFDEAVAAYDAGLSGKTPGEVVDHYRQILASMQPTIDAGDQTLADVYNGQMLQDAIGYQKPVADARTAMADVNAEAVNQALRQQMSAIAAEEARKGYSGAGSFANNRLLGATITARQQAAAGKSAANLQNAQDVYGLQREDQTRRLTSLDLAPNRVQQKIALEQAPAQGLANLQNLRTQPLNFFRLSVGNPPPVQPIPSTGAGQIGLQALGQAASGVGSYYANQQNAAATQSKADQDWQRQMALIAAMRN